MELGIIDNYFQYSRYRDLYAVLGEGGTSCTLNSCTMDMQTTHNFLNTSSSHPKDNFSLFLLPMQNDVVSTKFEHAGSMENVKGVLDSARLKILFLCLVLKFESIRFC